MVTAKENKSLDGVGGASDRMFPQHIQLSRNLGVLPDAQGASHLTGTCGDSIEVAIKVERGIIADIRVLPHGCMYTETCACVMCDLARGSSADDAAQLDPGLIMARLPGLPPDHVHCAHLAVDSLCAAIEDYYRRLSPGGPKEPGGSHADL